MGARAHVGLPPGGREAGRACYLGAPGLLDGPDAINNEHIFQETRIA